MIYLNGPKNGHVNDKFTFSQGKDEKHISVEVRVTSASSPIFRGEVTKDSFSGLEFVKEPLFNRIRKSIESGYNINFDPVTHIISLTKPNQPQITPVKTVFYGNNLSEFIGLKLPFNTGDEMWLALKNGMFKIARETLCEFPNIGIGSFQDMCQELLLISYYEPIEVMELLVECLTNWQIYMLQYTDNEKALNELSMVCEVLLVALEFCPGRVNTVLYRSYYEFLEQIHRKFVLEGVPIKTLGLFNLLHQLTPNAKINSTYQNRAAWKERAYMRVRNLGKEMSRGEDFDSASYKNIFYAAAFQRHIMTKWVKTPVLCEKIAEDAGHVWSQVVASTREFILELEWRAIFIEAVKGSYGWVGHLIEELKKNPSSFEAVRILLESIIVETVSTVVRNQAFALLCFFANNKNNMLGDMHLFHGCQYQKFWNEYPWQWDGLNLMSQARKEVFPIHVALLSKLYDRNFRNAGRRDLEYNRERELPLVSLQASVDSNDMREVDLLTNVLEFLRNPDKKLYLLQGPPKSGKSAFAFKLAHELLKGSEWFPVYIDGDEFEDTLALKDLYIFKELSPDKLEELQETGRFLFIVDGIEQTGLFDDYESSMEIETWPKSKVLITSRSEFMPEKGNGVGALITKFNVETYLRSRDAYEKYATSLFAMSIFGKGIHELASTNCTFAYSIAIVGMRESRAFLNRQEKAYQPRLVIELYDEFLEHVCNGIEFDRDVEEFAFKMHQYKRPTFQADREKIKGDMQALMPNQKCFFKRRIDMGVEDGYAHFSFLSRSLQNYFVARYCIHNKHIFLTDSTSTVDDVEIRAFYDEMSKSKRSVINAQN